jgi:hypothetical protein
MTRTPIRPSLKPIARGRPPRARKPDPKTRRFAKHRCPEFIAWLGLQPCAISGARSWQTVKHSSGWMLTVYVVAAHVVKARGAGGDDLYSAIPMAQHLHDEQHRMGIKSFAAKYNVDLAALAREYAERWLATEAGRAWATGAGR